MAARLAVVALLTLTVLCYSAPSRASLDHQPPFQPGFPLDPAGAGRPYLGLPFGATLAPVGVANSETMIVFATPDQVNNQLVCSGHVYAYLGDGSLRWGHGLTLTQAPGMMPSVADINGDGTNDIVAGYGEFSQACMFGGGVKAFDGSTGETLWDFSTYYTGTVSGVYSAPAIGDVNADGQPEVVFGSWNGCIYMLSHAGQPLWNLAQPDSRCTGQGYFTGQMVDSSPALADLDGDGKLEIVIGTYHTATTGYLNVHNAAGALIGQWPMDAPVTSSPAIADLDDDGVFEIVVGAGKSVNNAGHFVQALHFDPAENLVINRLKPMWTGNAAGYVPTSPAIGDLDGDGTAEVVVIAPNGDAGTTGSSVYAWHGNNGALLFSRQLCDMAGNQYVVKASPVIADVVGDEKPEIVLAEGSEVVILNADGTFYTDQLTNACEGQPSTTSLTYWTGSSLNYIPAIGALAQSDTSTIIAVGAVSTPTVTNTARLFAWGGHNSGYAPWPQFHHNPAHTGYLDNVPPLNPSGFAVSPLTSTLTDRQVITVTWSSAGSDIGSGLAGYAVVWDHASDTIPKPTSLVVSITDTITVAPGNGTWYVHLRSVDHEGNGARTTLHFGPFLLFGQHVYLSRLTAEQP